MTQTDITTASVVAYNDGILHDEVDREVVALSTVSGACYGLNAVGSRIWHLMASPVRVGDLCAVLEQEFDVDRATCEREVLGLLKQALAEGMIKVEERSAGGRRARGLAGRRCAQPDVLSKIAFPTWRSLARPLALLRSV